MTILLLVRHALTDMTGKRLSGQAPGIHLSAAGEEQAARLAERLSAVRLSAVYASPLERCLETAAPIASSQRLAVTPAPELQEVGYGRWTGRPIAPLTRTALWRRVHTTPSSARFPDGEAISDVQRRAVGALSDIADRYPRGRVAVVSHADVIRMVLAHYAGIHLDLFQRLIVSPASVSAVELRDGGPPRIIRANDTGTLADLGPRGPRARSPARDSRRGRAAPGPGNRGRSHLG
jgi:probable phosphomutase (TIGR03848 family)